MDRLLLLCASLVLFLPCNAFDSVRCGRPKDVANAFIDAGDSALLHTSLRYTCMVGYKRKAGTSTLIQCVLDHGKPVWTSTELQCIRLSILVIVGVVGFCCWRMKMHAQQNYVVAIPMVAPTTTAENDEMLPPSDIPTG
ncbi:hypothetical protein ASZ78_007714 [Callipepla squamata]|uniref:Sushi domain-containing protein n=1 Tax=Callipepla squamata TaxID=9009 RepID=A0A226MRV9_CALSU|nr:hypothetical protein ASZ78_007714 [Callipepla squamata]